MLGVKNFSRSQPPVFSFPTSGWECFPLCYAKYNKSANYDCAKKYTVTKINFMKIEFDPAKNNKNIRERDLSFELVSDLDWASSITHEDIRKVYPERRFITLAYLNERLHVVCYALIADGIRVISFRKANKRERKDYESRTTD